MWDFKNWLNRVLMLAVGVSVLLMFGFGIAPAWSASYAYSKASPFSDVSSSWAKDYIMAIYDAGITSGYPDGTYRPDNPVTRAQMAKFIAKALHLNTPEECTAPPFSDVPTDAWYCPYVKAVKDAGIVTGYPDGTYRPDETVDGWQMAVFIARAMHLNTSPCTAPPFSDVPTDAWYCPYVKALKSAGIVSGYPDGTYRPDELIRRDRMAAFIAKAFLGVGFGSSGSEITNLQQAEGAISNGFTAFYIALNSANIESALLLPMASVPTINTLGSAQNRAIFGVSLPSLSLLALEPLFRDSDIAIADGVSGEIACAGGGSYTISENCDGTSGVCSYITTFNSCNQRDLVVDGSVEISTTSLSGSGSMDIKASNLTVSYYNEDGSKSYSFSAPSLDMRVTMSLNGDNLTKVIEINGTADVDNSINGYQYTLSYDNLSCKVVTPVNYSGPFKLLMETNGKISESLKNPDRSMNISYDSFRVRMTTSSGLDVGSIDGTITVSYSPEDFCSGASGPYTFKTVEPIQYDEAAGMDTSGKIYINNTLFQWGSDGSVSVYSNGEKIGEEYEDELIDTDYCSMEAFGIE